MGVGEIMLPKKLPSIHGEKFTVIKVLIRAHMTTWQVVDELCTN